MDFDSLREELLRITDEADEAEETEEMEAPPADVQKNQPADVVPPTASARRRNHNQPKPVGANSSSEEVPKTEEQFVLRNARLREQVDKRLTEHERAYQQIMLSSRAERLEMQQTFQKKVNFRTTKFDVDLLMVKFESTVVAYGKELGEFDLRMKERRHAYQQQKRQIWSEFQMLHNQLHKEFEPKLVDPKTSKK